MATQLSSLAIKQLTRQGIKHLTKQGTKQLLTNQEIKQLTPHQFEQLVISRGYYRHHRSVDWTLIYVHGVWACWGLTLATAVGNATWDVVDPQTAPFSICTSVSLIFGGFFLSLIWPVAIPGAIIGGGIGKYHHHRNNATNDKLRLIEADSY